MLTPKVKAKSSRNTDSSGAKVSREIVNVIICALQEDVR